MYLADTVDTLYRSTVVASQLKVLVHIRVDVDRIHDWMVVVIVQQAKNMTYLMHRNL